MHATGATAEDLDPATGEVVALVRQATAADVDDAVRRAADAFAGARWRNDGALRARVLHRYADRLREHAGDLAELLTREQGKTMGEARSEIAGSADMVDFYAGLARAVYGRSIALGDTAHGVILREPAGVVAIITPWNWPLTLLERSLAPALAAGNACVVKPASLTPAITVAALALLADDPDLPDGILTCVTGPGREIGDALVAHPGVDMVAFTGESGTGAQVMRTAAATAEEGRARAGRQVAQHRVRRRQPRQGPRRRPQRDLHHVRDRSARPAAGCWSRMLVYDEFTDGLVKRGRATAARRSARPAPPRWARWSPPARPGPSPSTSRSAGPRAPCSPAVRTPAASWTPATSSPRR